MGRNWGTQTWRHDQAHTAHWQRSRGFQPSSPAWALTLNHHTLLPFSWETDPSHLDKAEMWHLGSHNSTLLSSVQTTHKAAHLVSQWPSGQMWNPNEQFSTLWPWGKKMTFPGLRILMCKMGPLRGSWWDFWEGWGELAQWVPQMYLTPSLQAKPLVPSVPFECAVYAYKKGHQV